MAALTRQERQRVSRNKARRDRRHAVQAANRKAAERARVLEALSRPPVNQQEIPRQPQRVAPQIDVVINKWSADVFSNGFHMTRITHSSPSEAQAWVGVIERLTQGTGAVRALQVRDLSDLSAKI